MTLCQLFGVFRDRASGINEFHLQIVSKHKIGDSHAGYGVIFFKKSSKLAVEKRCHKGRFPN